MLELLTQRVKLAQEPKSLRFGTFAPLRCRNCLFQVGRSHEPELGFCAGDGGVRVELPALETLLDKSFPRLGQRPLIQPLVLAQVGES